MQLDLQWVLRAICRVTLTPIIRYCVSEDISVAREAGSGDGAADLGVPFKTVLGVFVPEVECAIAAGGGKCAVDGVEGDCVNGVDFCDVAGVGVLLAVAFEGEVEARVNKLALRSLIL
jgi:hypothetical protein